MPTLNNPFAPFLTALTNEREGHATIHGVSGQLKGSIDTHGHVQHLHDEIGRNIGTIDHLSHTSATLHSASGALAGSAHTLGHDVLVSNASGVHEATIHHGINHDSIEQNHHPSQTVDHHGHTDLFHDAHGAIQSVDY
jgi:hypothetical protein